MIKSHNNTKSEESYLLDSKNNHCDIFYDPKDHYDSTVSFSPATPQYVDENGKKYYGGSSFSEEIEITIKDDKGLKNYTCTVIGPDGKIVEALSLPDDLSSGALTTETIEVDSEEIVDGETVITTKSVDISYNVPVDRNGTYY
ncbi:MAG: hypothetical protein ACLUOO_10475 [Coprococcus sp.]